MKKLLLFLFVGLVATAARAQTSCNAACTWVQTPGTYSVTFTKAGTVSPAMPPSSISNTFQNLQNGTAFPFPYIYYNAGGTATYNFGSPGTYFIIASLYYTDSINNIQCSDTTHYWVTLTQQPCAVSISSVTGNGMSRTFTANGGVASAGTTYTWNFGDGSPTVTGISASHTYTTSGSYVVTVTATGSGCTQSATTNVTITPPLNCANVSNSFTYTGTGTSRTFYPAATPTNYPRTHYWDFGNGGSAVTYGTAPASSVYPMAGTYTVCLITMWTDSANNIACTDTVCQAITVAGGTTSFNCANASNAVSASVSGATVTLTPTVTPLSTPGITVQNVWNFGNGWGSGGAYTAPVSHTYSVGGVYTARWITNWVQTSNQAILCRDTAYVTYSVTVPVQNLITGFVQADSTNVSDSFKVWLITFDAQTSMLAAVDSVKVVGNGFAYFQFPNKPAGVYRTKAAKMYQVPSSVGYVPTYRDSSLTWSGAQTFTHNNGYTQSGRIYLKQGIVTSGPGFVGGSVLSGANKGTADGDPVANQLVFLRDAASGSLVQSTYTNTVGQYSFSNVPLGNYRVYPEEMNYTTTASTPIAITAGNASVSGILFKKDDVDRDIKQVTTGLNDATVDGVGFTMVPNPANGWVDITTAGMTAGTEVSVRISSIAGQTVYSGTTKSGQLLRVDVRSLPAGIYTTTVVSGTASQTTRLIVQH